MLGLSLMAACGDESATAPATPGGEVCGDGADNDNDGYLDCADQDCWAHATCGDGSPDGATSDGDSSGDGSVDGSEDAPAESAAEAGQDAGPCGVWSHCVSATVHIDADEEQIDTVPNTDVFDPIVGETFEVHLGFDITSSEEEWGTVNPTDKALRIHTGPVQLTITGGPQAPLQTVVLPSLQGGSLELLLNNRMSEGDVFIDMQLVGLGSGPQFRLLVSDHGGASGLGVDVEDTPVLVPFEGLAADTSVERWDGVMTDRATGTGSYEFQ